MSKIFNLCKRQKKVGLTDKIICKIKIFKAKKLLIKHQIKSLPRINRPLIVILLNQLKLSLCKYKYKKSLTMTSIHQGKTNR